MVLTAILFVQTGSPDAPETGALRRYLAQFLGDKRVFDPPAWIRPLLLYGIILPFRPPKSAALYREIWKGEKAPLVENTLNFSAAVEKKMTEIYRKSGWSTGKETFRKPDIFTAMRYGNPSLSTVLKTIKKEKYSRIIVVPLFPQYASATTGSILEEVHRDIARWNYIPELITIPAFGTENWYLDAFAAHARNFLPAIGKSGEKKTAKKKSADEKTKDVFFLFSFHGLPERHIKTESPECLRDGSTNCCEHYQTHNPFCYRAQATASARKIAERLQIPEAHYRITFQSRFGREPWLTPATDRTLRELAGAGKKKVVIFTPGFVADGLETLEEIAIQGKELYLSHGGEDFQLVGCLNDDAGWVEQITQWLWDRCQSES